MKRNRLVLICGILASVASVLIVFSVARIAAAAEEEELAVSSIPVSTPARLPFLGTAGASFIEAAGDVRVGRRTVNLQGNPLTLARGDFNGDGHQDIVAGGGTLFAYDVTHRKYLWAVDESSRPYAAQINCMAVADLTGPGGRPDGIPDVLTLDGVMDPDGTPGVGSDGLTLWDGRNGRIAWSKMMRSSSTPGGTNPEVLAVADLDGDRVREVVAAGYLGAIDGSVINRDAVAAFDGRTGRLLWHYSQSSPVNGSVNVAQPFALRVGDVDRDRKPEVVAIGGPPFIFCLNGENHTERFVASTPSSPFPAQPLSVELGKFDRDGDLEIAVGFDRLVWALDGEGGVLWQYEHPYGASWGLLRGADFNRDGITDLAAAGTAGGGMVPVAVIDGANGFSLSGFSSPYAATALEVANLDRAGAPELALGGGDLIASLDPATGRWLWRFNTRSGVVRDVEIADFRGAGLPQVASVGSGGTFVSIVPAKASSGLWGRGFEPFSGSAGSHIVDVVATDLNGDGIADVIAADAAFRQVTAMNGVNGAPLWATRLLTNPVLLASGNFDRARPGREIAVAAGGRLYLLTATGRMIGWINDMGATNFIVADLDGDRADELVLGTRESSVRAYDYASGALNLLWEADITFGYGQPNVDFEEGFAWGDINDDGANELLALGYSGSSYFVYNLNRITGALTSIFNSTTAFTTIALARLDADPQREIILGSAGSLIAYDAKLATSPWTVNGIDAAYYLVAGDVDGDRRDEVVWAGQHLVGAREPDGSEKWTRDLEGTPAKHMTDRSEYITDMVLADLDGDGDRDVAVAASLGSNLLMLDGRNGANLALPVTVDGNAGPPAQLAVGEFGTGAGLEVVLSLSQVAGVFAVHRPIPLPTVAPGDGR